MTSGGMRGRSQATVRKAAALAALAFGVAGMTAASPALAAGDSNSCTSPTATIADGFAGDTYVRLRAQKAGSETLICVRLDNGSSLKVGGLVTIGDPNSSVVPTPDGNADSCLTTSGNQASPQTLVKGRVGGGSAPVDIPYEVDQYRNADEAWICVNVGSYHQRLIVKVPDSSALVGFEPDGAGVSWPVPSEPESGLPSSECHNGVGGTKKELTNINAAGTRLLVGAWQPSTSKLSLCVRASGPVSGGGRIDVDAANLPSIGQAIGQDSTATPCTLPVIENEAPVQFKISVSPGTSLPASVCVTVNGQTTRYFVKDPGPTAASPVDWTEDPTGPTSAADQLVQDALDQAGSAAGQVDDAATGAEAAIASAAQGAVVTAQDALAQAQATAAGTIDSLQPTATRVGVSGGELRLDATPGVANAVTIGYQNGLFVVVDQAGVKPEAPGCVAAGTTSAICTGAVGWISTDLSSGDDSLQLSDTLPPIGTYTYGTERFFGGPGPDTLEAQQGNENDAQLALGGAGDDDLRGAAQAFGGDGNDEISTGPGAVDLEGENGNDSIYGTDGSMGGGAGDDDLHFAGTGSMDGGAGHDTMDTAQSLSVPNGTQRITARDGETDTVGCWGAQEVVVADVADQITGSCDSVTRS